MKKIINVVCAIIIDNNKVFAAQRASSGEVGLYWEFPGGKIEAGEDAKEALIREIEEELAWDITAGDLFTTIHHEYETFIINLSAYICSVKNHDFKLKEHLAFKWLRIKDLNKVKFAAADKKIVSKLEKFNL